LKIFQSRSRPESEHATDTDGTAIELASSDTSTVRTLILDEESANTGNDNEGIDPYNSGSFDASKL